VLRADLRFDRSDYVKISKLRVLFFIGLLASALAACDESDDGGSGGSGDDADRPGRDLGVIEDGGDGGGEDGGDGGGDDCGGAAVCVGNADCLATEFCNLGCCEARDGNGDGGGDFSCDDIPVNAQAGTPCTGAEGECADGACVSTEAGGDATCSQICVPGECEGDCTGGERCLTLVDAETGQPQTIPGTSLSLGVCGELPTGDAGAFDQCGGDAGACQAGMDCLVLNEGDTLGQCFPNCNPDGSCTEGECAIQAGDNQYCVLTCTTAGGAGECPDPMVCVGVTGGAICHY